MTNYVRIPFVVALGLGLTSVAFGGWGHRHGYHHAGYVPYGYAPAAYSQPGYFQSGGSVSQLIFGDRQPTIAFDGFGFGVDFELVDGGGDGELVPVRSLRTIRTAGSSQRTLRLVRASELDLLTGEDEGEDEQACEDVRAKLEDLEARMDKFESSLKELTRLVKGSLNGEAPEPAGDAADLPGGEVGELMSP